MQMPRTFMDEVADRLKLAFREYCRHACPRELFCPFCGDTCHPDDDAPPDELCPNGCMKMAPPVTLRAGDAVEGGTIATFQADGAPLVRPRSGMQEDPYRAYAAKHFNVLPEAVTEDQRRWAKTRLFGEIYGVGAADIRRMLEKLDLDPWWVKAFRKATMDKADDAPDLIHNVPNVRLEEALASWQDWQVAETWENGTDAALYLLEPLAKGEGRIFHAVAYTARGCGAPGDGEGWTSTWCAYYVEKPALAVGDRVHRLPLDIYQSEGIIESFRGAGNGERPLALVRFAQASHSVLVSQDELVKV